LALSDISYLNVSDRKLYQEMARNHEAVMRVLIGQAYRRAAYAYVMEALTEYLEEKEAKRVRGTS
jgi:hypothetical protein